MPFYGQYAGFGAGGVDKPPTLMSMITDASLTTNLVLCLDAGDGSSYSSGQDWVDVSGAGNGDEFHRGSGTGSDSADPTFNGSADARTSAEYWSFDGGDYFTYGAANEDWMQIHKNNAKITCLMAAYLGDVSGATGMFATTETAGGVGFEYSMTSGETIYTSNLDASPPVSMYKGSSDQMPLGEWIILGLSMSEGGGNVSFFFLNGAYDQVSGANTFDAVASAPSGSNATSIMTIGARPNANNPFPSGARIGCIAMWEDNLSFANLDTIFDVLKLRYGIS